MTLNVEKGIFGEIFHDFRLPHTFDWLIAPKRLEIDNNNLRMKFLALNADFSDVSADLVAPRVTE
jgi:hypothetical protein